MNNNTVILANFEVFESSEENAVYKKIIKNKGKTNKQIKNIQSSLPTTTIHYISDEELKKLKQIELDLKNELYGNTQKNPLSSVKKYLFNFLEI